MNAEGHHDTPPEVIETAHKQSAVMMEIATYVINLPVLIFPFLSAVVHSSTRASALETIVGAHGGH